MTINETDTDKPDEELLSVAQVAAGLSVDKLTVRRWIASGELDAVRLGRGPLARIRVPKMALARFMRTGRGTT
jgi:excisionase family DNA binding protein